MELFGKRSHEYSSIGSSCAEGSENLPLHRVTKNSDTSRLLRFAKGFSLMGLSLLFLSVWLQSPLQSGFDNEGMSDSLYWYIMQPRQLSTLYLNPT